MTKFYLPVLLLLFKLPAFCQLPEFQWAKAFLDNNAWNYNVYNNGRTVCVDESGNVYSAGLFNHTVDFDPGPGSFTLTTQHSSNTGIYISKLDANGNFLWAKQVPTLVEFGEIEMKLDKDGNVYLASHLHGAADMDPGTGVEMMTTIGARDAFVIKLDTDGNLVWVKQFGGPGDTVPEATVLDIDKDNNVVICGLFNNTVDFDPGPGTFNMTSTAHIQAFIVKLTNTGHLIWAKQFGNSPAVYGGSHILDVKCDLNGDIYTTGFFAGTSDFDPGPGVSNLTASSVGDGFICKWTANGDFRWVKHMRNATTEYNNLAMPRAIDIDNMNNVVTTGGFIGTQDFDSGTPMNNTTSNPSYDCYIMKLTEAGELTWLKIIGGSLSDMGNDLVIDPANNIYVTGEFSNSLDFDPGPGEHTVNTSHYGPSALVKLSPSGSFVYAAIFPPVTNYGTAVFRRMAIDKSRNIYITGFTAGGTDFDPGPDEFVLNGSYYQMPFVLKLSPCGNPTSSSLHVNACNSYTLNDETFSKSGTYTQTLSNSVGCDSIITLHLTINRKSTEQTKVICEGEELFVGGASQTMSGTYVDTLQTVLGCDSVITTHLIVHPKPVPDLGPDKNLCSNTTLTLTPGTFAQYVWQNASSTSTLLIETPGKYWVTVTNNFGCSATDTINIPSILETPSNFLNETDSICNYGKLILLPNKRYQSYEWSTGYNGEIVQVEHPGIYWLQVIDENGCVGKDSITVFEKHCLSGIYFSNAFTPDGDGKNDIFKPVVARKVKQYRFSVFNRWGSIVFQTTDTEKGWDGKVGGNVQSAGVFIWTCSYQFEDGEPKLERGTVTIIH